MKITIYSTTTCPYCALLKKYFKEKGINYIEKFVDIDEVAKYQMSRDSNGFMGVPYTVIVQEDGGRDTIVGFDKGKLDTIFK